MPYAITTLRHNFEGRTVGIFERQEDAERCLASNAGDLNKAGYYPTAVIEMIDFGLYPIPEIVAIYRWVADKWVASAMTTELDDYLRGKDTGVGAVGWIIGAGIFNFRGTK